MSKEASVVENRNLYIGGSDIPVIMNISPFKTRFDLLLEKAGLQESTPNEFTQEYAEYGDIMEPKIRDYINTQEKKPYAPNCLINGTYRCNVDGFNGKDTILEIKTSAEIYRNVNEYKMYLVQLLFYIYNYNVKKGKLAVYERPTNFDTEFDDRRLSRYDINIKDYKELLEDILEAVRQFEIDLEKVKANPLITEEELQPNDLIELSYQVLDLEVQLASFKKLKERYELVKKNLYESMVNNNIKKWTTNNGIKITRVDEILSTIEIVKEFDIDKFKSENEETYNAYLIDKEKVKEGRSGYVKITLPKEE